MNGQQKSYLPAVHPMTGNFGFAEQGGNVLAAYRHNQNTQAAAYLYTSPPPPLQQQQQQQQQPHLLQPNYPGCNTAAKAKLQGQDLWSPAAAPKDYDCGGGSSWNFDELAQLLQSQPVWSDPCLLDAGDSFNSESSPYEPKPAGNSVLPVGYTPWSAAAASARSGSEKLEAVWTGTMPVRVYKNARFSQKLFVGGLPLIVKSVDLQKAFGAIGNVRVILPKARNSVTTNQLNGYCHVVVKDGKSVKRLLSKCQKSIDNPDDSITLIVQSFEYFYELQLNNSVKRVQVIPWCINDSNYTNQMNSSSEKHVVFVGALHGIMTAEFLGRVMSDLFGNIEFVKLDTDRFEYPIGSASVGFTSRDSYLKALRTNFVKIKTSRFTKVVQIEPYLEDSACSLCANGIGVNFCKSDACFRYYCCDCWERVHACLDRAGLLEHQRLQKKRQEGVE